MKRIIIFFAILIFFYLTGSFINISFDASKWTMECRTVLCVIGIFSSAMVSTFPGLDD